MKCWKLPSKGVDLVLNEGLGSYRKFAILAIKTIDPYLQTMYIKVSSMAMWDSKASTEVALDLLWDLAWVHPSSRPQACSSDSILTTPSYDVLGGLAIANKLDCMDANLNSNTTCHRMSILRSNPCNT